VLIANQKSNGIVVVERDAKTGLLGKTVQKLPMDAPAISSFCCDNRPQAPVQGPASFYQ
jgi:6-phosphogluconolactonase (cycloisomerase 2 family)